MKYHGDNNVSMNEQTNERSNGQTRQMDSLNAFTDTGR